MITVLKPDHCLILVVNKNYLNYQRRLFKMAAWNGSLVPSAIALAKSRVCKP